MPPLLPFLGQGLAGGEGLGAEPAADWGLAQLADALRLFCRGHPLGLAVYACFLALAVGVLAVKDRTLLALAAGWIVLPAAVVLLAPFIASFRPMSCIRKRSRKSG